MQYYMVNMTVLALYDYYKGKMCTLHGVKSLYGGPVLILMIFVSGRKNAKFCTQKLHELNFPKKKNCILVKTTSTVIH